MIAETREKEEGASYEAGLKDKLRRYLRSEFGGGGIEGNEDAARELLLQEAASWCVNRGVRLGRDRLASCVNETLGSFSNEWKDREKLKGKKGDSFGKSRGTAVPAFRT